MNIRNLDRININYNVETMRAEIESVTHVPLITIALFQLQDDASRFDHVKAFCLKNFTWSWIVVKDDQGKETNQIININSIVKHTGLSSKDIKTANKAGKLYETIQNRIYPSKDKMTELSTKKAAVLLTQPQYNIDEISRFNFLASIETYFKSRVDVIGTPASLSDIDVQNFGVIFAHYAYLRCEPNKVKLMINTLSDNRFNMIRMECRQRIIDKANDEIDALYL